MTLLDNTITGKPVVLIVALKIYQKTTIRNSNKKIQRENTIKNKNRILLSFLPEKLESIGGTIVCVFANARTQQKENG